MAVSIQTIQLLIIYFITLIFLFILVCAPFYVFESKTIPINESPTELHGNFLHITDFHPDPHYVSNVTARSRCHARVQNTKRPMHMKKGISGPWGAPATVCDSPLSLIDATFEWLEKNWKNKIDFIIWTGDNSRHDNDDDIPRTPEELFRLNRMIADKFLKAFNNNQKKHAPHFIPIIPSIGNNDIHPNNIILPGPNHMLTVLHDIWSPFIPKGQHKTFLNGGYFYKEVIPGKLMVVSLNTLYFYKANTAVNGCKAKHQPGTIQMRWLNGVLKKARKDGIKVYLTGHVAPRAKQYTKSCYKRYGRLALKYHEMILGHFYGHSNLDHFLFISSKSVKRRSKSNPNDDEVTNNENVYKEEDEDDDEYDEDEEEGDEYDEGDKNEILKIGSQEEQMSFEVPQESQQDDEDEEDGKVETNVYNIDKYLNRLIDHYSKIPRLTRGVEKEHAVININPSVIPTFFPALRIFKYNTTEVKNKDTTDDEVDHADAPSQINTFLTPLGYTQYFINLTHANLYPNITPEYTIEYTTWDDYRMEDLTVPSYIQLARRVVNHGFKSSLWKKIKNHIMVGTRSLVREKSKKDYNPEDSRAKDPEDYIVSELSF